MIKYKFSTYISGYCPINKTLEMLLENNSVLRHHSLKKGSSLLLPKMEVEEMHYLAKGMCKAFWLDENNEEQIFMLWPEDNLVVLWEHFFAIQRNTLVHIVAMEDCEFLSMGKTQLDSICVLHPEMMAAIDKIRAAQMESRNLQLQLLMKKEGDRYACYRKLFSVLKNRLGEKDLCAFLGIRKTTLFYSKRNYLFDGGEVTL